MKLSQHSTCLRFCSCPASVSPPIEKLGSTSISSFARTVRVVSVLLIDNAPGRVGEAIIAVAGNRMKIEVLKRRCIAAVSSGNRIILSICKVY